MSRCGIHLGGEGLVFVESGCMSKTDRRKYGGTHSPPAPSLLPLRLLVLVTASLIVGLVVGALTWHVSGGDAAASALAGITASGVTLDRLHRWTGP